MSSEQAWLESRATGTRLVLEEFAVVGRAPSVRLRLEDAGVSREHASLRRRDGGWWVQDLGSANGTFVNGLPATVSTPLRNGDEVSFGPARYVFHGPGGEAHSATSDTFEMTLVGRPHGEVTQVTLLVADVIGYSQLSAHVPPDEISRVMSAWCGHCRTVMQRCGGHIDKFIGDCVFAWWRGSDPVVKAQALQAARLLKDDKSPAKLADGTMLRCGIGLHAGEAALSRLGPSSYTLLGADVNLAFRIESLTRKLEPLVVSRPFAGGWPEGAAFTFPSLGTHEVKGWHLPVEVCAVREGTLSKESGESA
jgi:adenylate cyclase